MSTAVGVRAGGRDRRAFPADGPIEAALGYGLFYVLVDRATPTVVSVLGDAMPGVSTTAVRLGLAALLWFVLVVTAIDQLRRQLVALGALEADEEPWWPGRAMSGRTQALAALAGLLVGGVLAALLSERAIATAVALIPIVAALDVAALDLVAVLLMAVFFVAYSVATCALDRLVMGSVRSAVGG